MNLRLDGEAAQTDASLASGAPEAAGVLMIFLEPAPYIRAFVEAARRIWPGRIDVLYAAAQMTQNWDFGGGGPNDTVLSASRPLAMAEIKSRIASGRYALLHLAGWGHPLLWRAMLFARGRIPVTVQSDTPAPRGEPVWRRLAKRLLYGVLFRMPAMFTPAGTPQAEYIRSFGVPASRIRIAQLAVDVQDIQKVLRMPGRLAAVRARLGLSPDCVAILYVGRLEPHKGIDDMMEAFTELVRAVPQVRLLIAGEGTLRDRIIHAVVATPSVRYLGRLMGDDLWEAYAAADICIVPSRFEPWGLVVNEAMAAGLPVIVTDCVGSAPDLVRDGSTGIVVPTASPVDFTRAMAKLSMQPELRQSMGRLASEAIAAWTPANQAKNTLAAWREVLSA